MEKWRGQMEKWGSDPQYLQQFEHCSEVVSGERINYSECSTTKHGSQGPKHFFMGFLRIDTRFSQGNVKQAF